MTGTAKTASPSLRTRTSLGLEFGTGMTGTVTVQLDTFVRRLLLKCNVITLNIRNIQLLQC